MPANSTAVTTKPGHEEVDVGDAAGVDRAAEHVAEDQQEHRALDRADDDQLRRPHELADGSPRDRPALVNVMRRAPVAGDRG